MFVYNDYWKAEYGFLVYPLNEAHANFYPAVGEYLREPGSHCIVAKINILKFGRLDRDFTMQLIKYIQSAAFPEYAR